MDHIAIPVLIMCAPQETCSIYGRVYTINYRQENNWKTWVNSTNTEYTATLSLALSHPKIRQVAPTTPPPQIYPLSFFQSNELTQNVIILTSVA